MPTEFPALQRNCSQALDPIVCTPIGNNFASGFSSKKFLFLIVVPWLLQNRRSNMPVKARLFGMYNSFSFLPSFLLSFLPPFLVPLPSLCCCLSHTLRKCQETLVSSVLIIPDRGKSLHCRRVLSQFKNVSFECDMCSAPQRRQSV